MRRWALVLGAVALIAVQFLRSLPLSVGALAVWLIALTWLAPQTLRRVYRPRLWAFSLALAVASGLLIGTKDAELFGLAVSTRGLIAGVWMVVRGISLITLASLGASALTRPGFSTALARVGLPGAARAMRVAVDTLPTVQERLAETWREKRAGARGLRGRLAAVEATFAALLAETARRAEQAGGEDRETEA